MSCYMNSIIQCLSSTSPLGKMNQYKQLFSNKPSCMPLFVFCFLFKSLVFSPKKQGCGSALIDCGSGSSIFPNCGSWYRSGFGSSSESRVLMTKNCKKCITYLGFHKGRTGYRRSLQPLKVLRFWNLYYFFISYVKILRFYKKSFLIRPLLGEIRFFRLVWD